MQDFFYLLECICLSVVVVGPNVGKVGPNE